MNHTYTKKSHLQSPLLDVLKNLDEINTLTVSTDIIKETNSIIGFFNYLPKLNKLCIEGDLMFLSEYEPSLFSRIKNLKELELRSTSFFPKDFVHFPADLERIQIDVLRNQTQMQKDHVANLKSLKTLVTSNEINQYTAETFPNKISTIHNKREPVQVKEEVKKVIFNVYRQPEPVYYCKPVTQYKRVKTIALETPFGTYYDEGVIVKNGFNTQYIHNNTVYTPSCTPMQLNVMRGAHQIAGSMQYFY